MSKRKTARGLIFINNSANEMCLAVIHRIRPDKQSPDTKRDYYVIPGGGVETGETIFATVVREIKEELGIEVAPDRLLYTQETKDAVHNYIVCSFVCGAFGKGKGPEFTDRRIKERGQYIPELIPLDKIQNINLVPLELKLTLAGDLLENGFSPANLEERQL